jgi:hypothetical protein
MRERKRVVYIGEKRMDKNIIINCVKASIMFFIIYPIAYIFFRYQMFLNLLSLCLFSLTVMETSEFKNFSNLNKKEKINLTLIEMIKVVIYVINFSVYLN